MADYRKMYLRLVDKTEQVLDILDSDRDPGQKVFLAKALLAAGLQDCEDIYIETAESRRTAWVGGSFSYP